MPTTSQSGGATTGSVRRPSPLHHAGISLVLEQLTLFVRLGNALLTICSSRNNSDPRTRLAMQIAHSKKSLAPLALLKWLGKHGTSLYSEPIKAEFT
jgi:hypothetical protein